MTQHRVMRIIARMNVGGPAVQIASLMRHLSDSEFDQRLLTGFCDGGEADFIDSQAPDVSALRIHGLGRHVRPLDDLQVLRALIHQIREFDPHIIHTHTAKAGLLGRIAAASAQTHARVIHTYHGHLLHGYFSPRKTRALINLERVLAKRTTKLIAVGAQVRDDLLAERIGKQEDFQVIPPGLTIGSRPKQKEARHSLRLPQGLPVIGFIGRLTQIKRPDRFAAVVDRVVQEMPDVHFVVAGSGDLARETHDLTQHSPVTMLGWRSDVETVLAACDLILLTSDNEGTPLSLIQAGMAGLPVVASDVGAVRDVVVDGETGWLTKPTSTALARAVLQFLTDRQEGERRGLAGEFHTKKLFSIERLVLDHENLYREVLAQDPSI